MNSSGRRNFRRGRGYLFRGNGRGQGNRHVRGKGSPSTPAQRDTIESRNVFHQTTLVGRCPFRDWRAYFPDDVYIPNSSLDRKIHTFQNYIETGIGNYSQDEIEAQGSMTIDFKDLVSNSDVIEKIPNLAEELKDNPNKTIQALSLAAYQVFAAGYDSLSQPDCQTPFELPQIQARIFNYDPVTPLKNLKASCYGKFVAIVGTVVRVSCIKPLVTQMAFVCNMCKETQVLAFADGKYRVPTKCESDACRARTFIPQQSSPLTKTIDWQTVKIQEIKDDDQREAGRIPRTVECELEADLVDSAVPGDIVKICGEVKVTDAEESKTRQKDKCMFQLYISANSVENFKATRKATESGNDLVAEFTLKELYAIQEIQAEKNLFRLIVGSVCPSIYGRELVKAGLVLGLFGGCQRFENDKNRVPVRGNPHVLVVGDPGLGKSQMLRAVSNLAPRGVYVCGNTTSAAGLTVTLHKETSSGESALEAGALVLADQGCCCIDEFDKMGSQHQALLEAMEQQTISIAKAGMVRSLPARTSILAAANPAGGYYNKAKTVSENLRMGSAILSRFDLVFIMLDKPDEEMDCVLSEHVMAIHSGKKSPFETVTVRRNHQNSVLDQNDDELRAQWEADKPLSERLKVGADEDFDPIPSVLLRKYIAYARKYVKPKLSSEAAAELQKFYVNLRKNHQGQDTTPITTRQLESLIRVTEARARLELREQVTKQDALDAIEIMKKSLVDTFTDEIGSLDFQRSQNGSGMSRTAQAKRFIAELEKIAEREFNSLFTVEQLKQLATDMKLNFGSLSFNDFIFSLNNQNYLLKKGARVYQLQTSCCL